jgi:hypothetical protein
VDASLPARGLSGARNPRLRPTLRRNSPISIKCGDEVSDEVSEISL